VLETFDLQLLIVAPDKKDGVEDVKKRCYNEKYGKSVQTRR